METFWYLQKLSDLNSENKYQKFEKNQKKLNGKCSMNVKKKNLHFNSLMFIGQYIPCALRFWLWFDFKCTDSIPRTLSADTIDLTSLQTQIAFYSTDEWNSFIFFLLLAMCKWTCIVSNCSLFLSLPLTLLLSLKLGGKSKTCFEH